MGVPTPGKGREPKPSTELRDFKKLFAKQWHPYSNAKSGEKLQIIGDVLRLLAAKPPDFVAALLQVDPDCVSRLVTGISLNRKHLGTHIPHHFTRFLVQVRDALEKTGNAKGENARLDRIALDLDGLKEDEGSTLQARLTLLRGPEDLDAFLVRDGEFLAEKVAEGHASLLQTLLAAVRRWDRPEACLPLLVRWLRVVCQTATKPAVLQHCVRFAEWAASTLTLEPPDDEAVKKLQRSAASKLQAAATDRPTATVDDGLRRRLLGSLYACTNEPDLAKLFVQVRAAIDGGKVGDYRDRLAVALARKVQSHCPPSSALRTDVHGHLRRLFPTPRTAPTDVRTFLAALPRSTLAPDSGVGFKRRREKAEACPTVPHYEVPPPPPKKRKTSTKATVRARRPAPTSTPAPAPASPPRKRVPWAVPRRVSSPPTDAAALYWAKGSLKLADLLRWKLRKDLHNKIFDL